MEKIRVPRFAFNIIGEMMIKEHYTKGLEYDVIGFGEFAEKYKTNSEFKKWLSKIEEIVFSQNIKEGSVEYNRLAVFWVFLFSFIEFFEPDVSKSYYFSFYLAYLKTKLNKSIIEDVEQGLLELKELANSNIVDTFRKVNILGGANNVSEKT